MFKLPKSHQFPFQKNCTILQKQQHFHSTTLAQSLVFYLISYLKKDLFFIYIRIKVLYLEELRVYIPTCAVDFFCKEKQLEKMNLSFPSNHLKFRMKKKKDKANNSSSLFQREANQL